MILTVRRDDSDALRVHVEQYHYLHRWPDPRALPFGYVLEVDGARHAPDGRLNGLVVFKKPQHHRHAGLFGHPGLPTAWQVLDLARVWINPLLQAVEWEGVDRQGRRVTHDLNLFSRIVSLALRRVQWDWLAHDPPRFPDLPYHIELVISYCARAPRRDRLPRQWLHALGVVERRNESGLLPPAAPAAQALAASRPGAVSFAGRDAATARVTWWCSVFLLSAVLGVPPKKWSRRKGDTLK